jgi:hypothetical protein
MIFIISVFDNMTFLLLQIFTKSIKLYRNSLYLYNNSNIITHKFKYFYLIYSFYNIY